MVRTKQHDEEIISLKLEIESLRTKLAEAEKDAERYRYLRNDPPVDLCVRLKTSKSLRGYMYVDDVYLDRIVDAAIARQKEESK